MASAFFARKSLRETHDVTLFRAARPHWQTNPEQQALQQKLTFDFFLCPRLPPSAR